MRLSVYEKFICMAYSNLSAFRSISLSDIFQRIPQRVKKNIQNLNNTDVRNLIIFLFDHEFRGETQS